MRLRRRLNTVLLQWFLLFVFVAGAVWFISLAGLRRSLSDDRILLARTIAQSIDNSLSMSMQSLGRLTADLPLGPDAAARLHAARFQSTFGEASYLLDNDGGLIAADPAGVTAVPASALSDRESVTSVVSKTADRQSVAAIVQPFSRDGRGYFLVAEMNPLTSPLNQFLKELKAEPLLHVAVVDAAGVVVASADPSWVLNPVARADAIAERIRSNRPLVMEGRPSLFGGGDSSLTVMAPLRLAPWAVVLEEPTGRAYQGARAMGRGVILSGLGLALLGVLVARTLSRSVVTPIRRLSAQAETMRAGDLSNPVAVSGDYEVEMLARTLDEARQKLGATLKELQAFNVRLEEEVVARTRVIVQQDAQRKVLVRRLLAATEDERRRLARELHDEIAQLLTVIQLSLHHVNVDTPEMRRASELLVRTQQEIHRIIYDLRPSLLDDLGLPAAIKSYAQDHLVREGLRVNLEIEEDLPAHPEIETAIFRIYQELVTNVLRHAHAENVSIELARRGGALTLTVEDDGRGFEPEAVAMSAGLTGMRERAALVNGTIRFESEPGVGTQVTVEIPLP